MKRRQSSRKRRPRKRAIKKFKPNLTYLHAYEEEVILADIRALGGQAVTAPGLDREFPGRYDRPYLTKALNRLHQARRLTRSHYKVRRFGSRSLVHTFSLPADEAQRAA
jgi:hypothetical protein